MTSELRLGVFKLGVLKLPLRESRRLAALLCACVLAACGGGSGSSGSDEAEPDRTSALTVGADGRSTYHVATTGDDGSGTGSAQLPFRSIGKGLSKLRSGDTLIVADGVYQNQSNFINDALHAIPSGTASGYTTVKAANPFKVRIQNVAPITHGESPLRVRGSYVQVDGFVFDLRDTKATPLVGELQGSYNKVTRSIFRRQGASHDGGGWLQVQGHHHLVEDVAGVGAARYGFATGGGSDTSHHIIFRRVVGRFDFSSSTQPKATFVATGSDVDWNVHHILYQNCIALDGQAGGPTGTQYGAWYFPKNLDTGQIVGSIALNNTATYAGLFVQELRGRNTLVSNSVSWATSGGAAGIRWNGTGSMALDRVTVGAHAVALTNRNSLTHAVLRNSLFDGNSALFDKNEGFAEFSGGAFSPVSQTYGTQPAGMSGALRHLPDASRGTGLTNVGAVILKRSGRSGTLWGEAGFDETTDEKLWPWAHEDPIKAVFAEPNTPLAGNTPAASNSKRGFTVEADAFGQPMTLTRYVWQALGHRIPDGIYPPSSATLAVAVTGSGRVGSSPAGIDCGNHCSEAFPIGSAVTLTASAAAGHAFAGWDGSCAGSSTSCTLAMSSARSVTASFVPVVVEHVLGVSVSGNGSVTSSPAGISCGSDCNEAYAAGTLVTLNASPGPGQAFSGWRGACSGSGSSCTVSMSAARSVTATFAAVVVVKHTLGVSVSGGGGVTSSPGGINCGSDCSETYAAGTQVTLTALPDAGQAFTGWSGDCSGSASSCTLTMSAARSVGAAFSAEPGRTLHVATHGSDATGDGSAAKPFQTIGRGISKLRSGETLVVGDGIYQNQANFINDHLHPIPSGSAGAYTVIRAANPFKVRIQNVAPTLRLDNMLGLNGSYIQVDGFVFDLRNTLAPSNIGNVGGSYNKVTRSIFRRQGVIDQFGGWLYVHGHHHLVEDVAGVGAARYGFGTGGPDDDSHHIIFRRVVGRFDFSSTAQPKATFNAYGTNGGWGVHHVEFQNCIALDGQNASTGGTHYGAWYFPKNMDGARVVGSIALNNAADFAGMFVQEQQGRDTLVSHSIVWGNQAPTGIRWNGSGAMTLHNVTVGAHAAALENRNAQSPAVLRNSLFVDNLGLFRYNAGFAEFSGSAFAPAGQAYGSAVAGMSAALQYLPDPARGTGLSGAGASVLTRIGRSGSVWGDPGYDETTTEKLWPWPYEDEIKAVFAEPNAPAAGNRPATNNTLRGFTVETDAYGRPMTLTRYIWQALGQRIPEGIYPAGN